MPLDLELRLEKVREEAFLSLEDLIAEAHAMNSSLRGRDDVGAVAGYRRLEHHFWSAELAVKEIDAIGRELRHGGDT